MRDGVVVNFKLGIKVCVRCGSTKNIESHHKIPRYKGGKDAKKNRENLCRACHDFKHTEINLKDALFYTKKNIARLEKKLSEPTIYKEKFERSLRYYRKRVVLLNYRLRVLRKLNKPSEIIIKGYTSYWTDPNTH